MSNPAPVLSLWDRVKAVNELLKAGEPHNISVDPYSKYTGYDPQTVIDACNEGLGPENWSFVVTDIIEYKSFAYDKETKERKEVPCFVARIAVSIHDEVRKEWVSRGPHVGGGRGDRDYADGQKAAITDGLKKCLASFSIGNRAYLGLLQADGAEKPGHSGGQSSGYGGGGGAAKPFTAWLKRLKEVGLSAPDPENPGKDTIATAWWHAIGKYDRDLPKGFSKWGPEEAARAMRVLDLYVQEQQANDEANGVNIADPFADQ